MYRFLSTLGFDKFTRPCNKVLDLPLILVGGKVVQVCERSNFRLVYIAWNFVGVDVRWKKLSMAGCGLYVYFGIMSLYVQSSSHL